ncbi:MAG: hypothetical protein SFX72_00195 [Isosphaeraceae bacterium]|nr:hypothetical protein [Isosphaeraceae bacterium]
MSESIEIVENRRAFTRQALTSLATVALLEGLAARGLFGADVEPIVEKWLQELESISRSVADHKTKDLEFQAAFEALSARVDLAALLKTLDFDRISRGVSFPAKGAKSLPVEYRNVAGIPTKLVHGRQIFAMRKGRSIVPHGHDNMATGFIILSGELRGRHYDRVEDHKDHYVIRPTIDRRFSPGEYSTISDHKDNVHWFEAESETAFVFNIHVMNTNPENPKSPGRVYVDPLGEKLSGGLIRAPKISYGKVNQLYG